MKAVFSNATHLETIVSYLKDEYTDVNFNFEEKQIVLQSLDTSQIKLCKLVIQASDLEEYVCDRNYTIGVNMVSFATFLDFATKESKLILEYDSKEPDFLNMTFTKSSNESKFRMKTIDIDSEILNMEDQEYDSVIKMPSTEFFDYCKKLSKIGDAITLSTTKKVFKLELFGDSGEGSISLSAPPKIMIEGEDEKKKPVEKDTFTLAVKSKSSGKYSLIQLKSCAKCVGISKKVEIHLTSDMPIFIRYKMFKKSFMGFYLAPKLDD